MRRDYGAEITIFKSRITLFNNCITNCESSCRCTTAIVKIVAAEINRMVIAIDNNTGTIHLTILKRRPGSCSCLVSRASIAKITSYIDIGNIWIIPSIH